MDANQLRFNQMCAAMADQFSDDDWDTPIIDASEATPEELDEDTEDLIDDREQREFIRWGGN